jgi:hypothetical protein
VQTPGKRHCAKKAKKNKIARMTVQGGKIGPSSRSAAFVAKQFIPQL